MEQRLPSTHNGRRYGDLWSKAGKTIAILLSAAALIGMTGRLWAKGTQVEISKVDIIDLRGRVVFIEQTNRDLLYMTCVMFAKDSKDAVPASCKVAVR